MFRTLLMSGIYLAMASVAMAEEVGDFRYQHEKFHDPYHRLVVEVNDDLGPGDQNYRNGDFGNAYRNVYSSGKCHCRSGYCRPSILRSTEYASPVGFDILVDDTWVPIPLESLQNETTLSPELMKQLFDGNTQAHVCAYPDASQQFGQRIECTIFPLGG